MTLRAELLIVPKPQFPHVSRSNYHMPQDGFVSQMKKKAEDRMTDKKQKVGKVYIVHPGIYSPGERGPA